MEQTTFGEKTEDRSAESDENSDITILGGEGSQEEKNLRDRSQGLELEQDDTEIEVL